MRPAPSLLAAILAAACSNADARPLPALQQGTRGAAATAAPDARVARADLARIAGKESAKLWILVISDFQCPYCKEYHDKTHAQVQREFVDAGIARMAFINYPLNMHPNAIPAAEAAMCAGAQDRFWTYHDKVFATQPQWAGLANPQPLFERMASELKLDVAAWKQCVAGHVMRPMIDADYQRGSQAGASSTPTFIVGRTVIPGNAPIDMIRKAVRENLAGTR